MWQITTNQFRVWYRQCTFVLGIVFSPVYQFGASRMLFRHFLTSYICTKIKTNNRFSVFSMIWIGKVGHNLRRGPIQRRFGPSCAHQVYFLCKSTEFSVMRTECQRILFHFSLNISHKYPAIAKALPSSVLAPNICSPIGIAVATQSVYSYRRWWST